MGAPVIAALLSWLKYSLVASLLLAITAGYLHGDAPLDAANIVGYWIVAPLLIGLLMLLFNVMLEALCSATKPRGQWPS